MTMGPEGPAYVPGILGGMLKLLAAVLVVFGILLTVLYYVHPGRRGVQALDFGSVREPPAARDAVVFQHLWEGTGGGSFRLEYGLAAALRDTLDKAYRAFDEKRTGRFVAAAVKGGTSRYVQIPLDSEVYRWALSHALPSLGGVGRRLAEAARQEGWTQEEVVEVVVGLVQSVRYEVPEDEVPFNLCLPPVTLSQGWGDCDSKSLLAVALLRHLGIESTLVVSNKEQHAILAVDLPIPGRCVMVRGRKWVLVETTSQWGIGLLPPGVMHANDWRVMDLEALWPAG